MEQKKSPPPSQGHGGTSSTASSDANNAESLSNEANKTETQLERALAYAERGWPVFPVYEMTDEKISWKKSKWNGARKCACGQMSCNSLNPESGAGKHPRTHRGFNDATTDPEQIRAWWTEWPNANIGIATGEGADLLVVDTDVHHENQNGFESIEEAEKTLGKLPDTLTARTGGDGEHRYHRHPTDGREYGPRSGVLPGVDVRADGGYIIAPGSNHRSGGTYEFKNDLPMAELPQKWANLIYGEPKPEAEDLDLDDVDFRQDLHDYLNRGSSKYPALWQCTGKTDGDTSRSGYAWSLLHSIHGSTAALPPHIPAPTPPDLKAHLVEFYRKDGLGSKHSEKWFDDTVSRFLAEVAEDDTETPSYGSEASTDADGDLDDADDTPRLPRCVCLADYLTHPGRSNPVEVLVPGLAWPRNVSLLPIRDKGGKSTVARSVAVTLTRDGGRVLIVGLEEDLEHLAGELMRMGVDPSRVYFFTVTDMSDAEIRTKAEEIEPDLIILDTLSEWLSLRGVTDENSSSQVLPHLKALRSLARDTGAALLLLHHSTKDGTEYRGSTAIGGGVDVVIHVSGSGDIRKFSPKGRVHTEPATYRYDGLMYHLIGGNSTSTTTGDDTQKRLQRVWNTVDEHPGISANKLFKKIPGDNIQLKADVALLIQNGNIEDRGTGHKHAYFTSLNPDDSSEVQRGQSAKSNEKTSLDSKHNEATGQRSTSEANQRTTPAGIADDFPCLIDRESANPPARRVEMENPYTPIGRAQRWFIENNITGDVEPSELGISADSAIYEENYS